MNEMTGNGMAADGMNGGSAARERLHAIISMQMDGQVQEAHDAYVRYFEEHDIDYPALNMFGLCCMALGRFDKASGLFSHIVENAPMIEEAFLYLAECHIELSQPDEALQVLESPLQSGNDGHKPHLLAARAHILNDNRAAAMDCLETASRLASDATDILLLIASLHMACENTEEADSIYKRILFDDPHNLEGLLGQSEVLVESKSWDAVIVNCILVLDRYPHHQRARFLHCTALSKLKRFGEMLESAKIMAAAMPEAPRALEVLSEAYIETGDNHAALMCAKCLIDLQPRNLTAHQVAASAYFRLGKFEKAVEINEALLAAYPGNLNALENLGVALERMRRLDEAIDAFDQVLASRPDRESAKFNKSISLLLKGEMKEGLRFYESRFNPELDMMHNYLGDEPLWDGKAGIKGKHLLIHPEQGLGDTLMCCRFIKYLADEGARLTFAVQPALRGMMNSLESPADIITVGEDLKDIDLHVPLMSLAHMTYDKWAGSSADDAYLKVPSASQRIWAEKLGSSSKLRIGFVCSGNPKHSNDAGRSLNMASFADSLPAGPEYHLLQKDLRDTDLAALARHPDIVRHDHEISDFSDTAALCSHMDLVVSVDTSVAHLAGAIGKRTMLMLPWWPDWRWGLDVATNIWYPNMISLRQNQAGDWNSVLEQLRKEICDELSKRNEAGV
ncbi:MAG: tetratricopeptide repeat protein [Candidatus Puniceispirillaceae bacterium]